MKQHLLSLAMAALVSGSMVANAEVTEQWWGRYKGDERIGSLGMGFPVKFYSAQYIPGNNPMLKGKTIKAIRFKCQGTAYYEECEAWVATAGEPNDPYSMGDTQELLSLDVATLADSVWNEVAITPVALPDEGIWVGWNMYASDISDRKAEYPVLVAFPGTERKVPQEDVFWQRASEYMTMWISSPQYGRLCLQVLVEGEFEDYAVTLGDIEPQRALAGSMINVPISITRQGIQPVENIDYTVGQQSYHYDLAQPIEVLQSPVTIEVPVQTGSEAILDEQPMTITHVNGQPNNRINQAVATLPIITIEEGAHRRVVMEEFTGTWCGWCPRGDIAVEKLNADFGDDFIAIGAHSEDVMEIPPYINMQMQVRSWPSAFVNRSMLVEPYSGSASVNYGIYDDVVSELAKLTEADIDIIAEWETADSLTINSIATTTFRYSAAQAPYALTYVLTCDSIFHPNDPDWLQSNFFNELCATDEEYASNPDYAEFGARPSWIPDMVYNRVAVDAYGVDEGLDESIAAPLVVGEKQKHEFSIDIDYNTLIQDKNQLKLIVMLLDTRNGKVINSARCPISAPGTLGIKTVRSNGKTSAASYSLFGTRVNGNSRGLHIERQGEKYVKVIR